MTEDKFVERRMEKMLETGKSVRNDETMDVSSAIFLVGEGYHLCP